METMPTTKNLMIFGGAATVFGFVVGAALTYWATEKDIREKYDNITKKEIADAKKFYSILHKKDEYSDPANLQRYTDVVDGLSYVTVHPGLEPILDDGTDEAAERIVRAQEVAATLDEIDEVDNQRGRRQAEQDREAAILAEAASLENFSYDDEKKNRTDPNKAYVISFDEWEAAEPDYSQATLNFYEGDEVLTDDHDMIIHDVEEAIGVLNLQRFGHGSKDPNIVYIRNDRIDVDFEVVRSSTRYDAEILGVIQHSETPSPAQRRRDLAESHNRKTAKKRRDDRRTPWRDDE